MKSKPARLTDAERAALQSGDVIFSRVPNYLYRQVAATTGSWDSHVGIVFREPDGRLIVAESCVPFCRRTTLDDFLANTENGLFAVRRLPGGLNEEQVRALRAEADRRMGRVYHLGFDFDANREFCSKFVFGAYRDALGVEVGTLQTFRELLAGNPRAPLGFWRLWFFGFIPWNRRTVTPTSLLRSPALRTVMEAA